MLLNALFPTRDIGTDPAKIRDWAQAAEGLGYHCLSHQHIFHTTHTTTNNPASSSPHQHQQHLHTAITTVNSAHILHPPQRRQRNPTPTTAMCHVCHPLTTISHQHNSRRPNNSIKRSPVAFITLQLAQTTLYSVGQVSASLKLKGLPEEELIK